MPELPEIETICRALQKQLCGATIVKMIVRRRDLRIPVPKNLDAVMTHSRVLAVRRRSKYLLIDLMVSHPSKNEDKFTLIMHLGMSGKFFFSSPDLTLDKHDHLLIFLDDGRQLRFRDPRRFGLVDMCPTALWHEMCHFKDLGLEPLASEFTTRALANICLGKAAPIKNLLMNAALIVGVGNIYASEALFWAGMHPQKKAGTLKPVEISKLQGAIQKVLNDSIKAGGTSFRDYVDADGKPGLHAVDLAVYGREGMPCKKCGVHIKKITMAGRSTFLCPACQPFKKTDTARSYF